MHTSPTTFVTLMCRIRGKQCLGNAGSGFCRSCLNNIKPIYQEHNFVVTVRLYQFRVSQIRQIQRWISSATHRHQRQQQSKVDSSSWPRGSASCKAQVEVYGSRVFPSS